MRSKNASHIFAVNPLYENMQSSDFSSQDVDAQISQCNADIEFNSITEPQTPTDDTFLRLNIPNRPEIVETNYETLSRLRSSNIRNIKCFNKLLKNRSDMNVFGGSLRVRSNNSIIW